MAAELVGPAASASFPVVFFDGDREIDVGPLPLLPSLGFKRFLAAVSQRIGVSPHQISLSLVRRKKARTSPDVRRKVPIDEATDLPALAHERDCFVLALLRRSRREKRGRSRRKSRAGQVGIGGDGEEGEKKALPEMKILRRSSVGSGCIDSALAGLVPEATDGIGLWEYETQMRSLQRQRERYLLSTMAAAAMAPYLPFAGPLLPAAAGEMPAACGECEAASAEGRSPGFHWCVHDAVTVGFRSPVGPIQRPPKKRVEASA
ncbi:hypothetical protein Cni_G24437 [Canna indica]|uniref:DUF7138 domain-containing protein n=1 Tax=Canna indica TaxID=4628 RepID=A0AAQ3L052_9LILI|nr:hypothetical protein Cni_G24437 [Canna indica]